MLVLGRYKGQKVKIGNDIILTITDVGHGGLVRLGFEAPPNIVIDREEVSIKRKINPWGKPNAVES